MANSNLITCRARAIRAALQAFAGAVALAGALTAAAAQAQDARVNRDVTVRAEPTRQSAPVDYAMPDQQVELLDQAMQQNGYYHVRLAGQREGWIYRTYLSRLPAQGLVEAASAIRQDRMIVHFIDVDQGNAALLEFPCAAVLIDAGGRGDVAALHLVSYLNAFFNRRTDLHRRFAAVFITHTHIDHNSNLKRLIDGRYQVGSYIHNGIRDGSGRVDARWMLGYAPQQSPPITVQAVSEADVEAAGTSGLTSPAIDPVRCTEVDPTIRLLSGGRTVNPGWSADDFGNGNNHSLVIRVDFGDASFLFPGDLENAGIADLMRRYAGTSMLDTDVIEVSHHGAENGTTPEFLAAVTPEIAVISMGPSSIHEQWTAYAYGHPRQRTVLALDQSVTRSRPTKTVAIATGAHAFTDSTLSHAIYATGWDGTVDVTADRSGQLAVRTEH